MLRNFCFLQDHFVMLLKIFVVMGVTYFFEFMGFILSWIYGTDAVWKYFVFNNIVNALQGVLIFIVLICKRSVLRQMKSKWTFSKEERLSGRISLNTPSSSTKECDDKYRTFTIGHHYRTDVNNLCGIAGKYSTSTSTSNLSTKSNVSITTKDKTDNSKGFYDKY